MENSSEQTDQVTTKNMKQKHSLSLHKKTFEIPHTVLIFNLEGCSKEQAIKNKCVLLGFYIELKTLKKDI